MKPVWAALKKPLYIEQLYVTDEQARSIRWSVMGMTRQLMPRLTWAQMHEQAGWL